MTFYEKNKNTFKNLNHDDLEDLQHNIKLLIQSKRLNHEQIPPRNLSDYRVEKRSNREYTNPYECSKQNLLPEYIVNEHISDGGKNVNHESNLTISDGTRTRGQRKLTETKFDRYQMLPFNPQETDHIVWFDGMPRGGKSTRNDKTQ
jgi:hypothetical protein